MKFAIAMFIVLAAAGLFLLSSQGASAQTGLQAGACCVCCEEGCPCCEDGCSCNTGGCCCPCCENCCGGVCDAPCCEASGCCDTGASAEATGDKAPAECGQGVCSEKVGCAG
ncbi:MAG: hypothetical protein EA378_07415 [Phycisphaerales bacterium]|nr:MAG: hypothetical protein EA378_07415 [Phycisphaerales bacterium]